LPQVELKGPDFFGGNPVGGTPVEAGEAFHGTDIAFHRVGGVVAQLQILNKASAQGSHVQILSRAPGEKDEGKGPGKGWPKNGGRASQNNRYSLTGGRREEFKQERRTEEE